MKTLNIIILAVALTLLTMAISHVINMILKFVDKAPKKGHAQLFIMEIILGIILSVLLLHEYFGKYFDILLYYLLGEDFKLAIEGTASNDKIILLILFVGSSLMSARYLFHSVRSTSSAGRRNK